MLDGVPDPQGRGDLGVKPPVEYKLLLPPDEYKRGVSNYAFCQITLVVVSVQLASEVNAAILSSCDQRPTSKLATFYRLLLWMQNELDRRKVTYERMVDVASATTETANTS